MEENHHASEAIKAIQILTQRHANDIKYLREQYDRVESEHQMAEKLLEKQQTICRDLEAIIAGNRMDQIKSMSIGFFIGMVGMGLVAYVYVGWL
jgi:hypothetical protein